MATKRTFDAEEEQKRQPAVNNTTPAVDMQLVETMKQQANQEYQASNPTPAKPTLKTDPVDNIQREIDKTYQSGIDAVNKQAEVYKQQQVHLYDVAKGFKDELEAEREKDSRLRNQENMRNIFGATGELVASLANLYQVGKGAPNTNLHPFTQDWMKEVDKKRKERKTSMDNIRDRQRDAESKLNALKAEQDANLASARLAVEQNRAKQQIAYEQQKAEQAIAEQARKDKLAQQAYANEYQAERDKVEDAQFAQTQAYRDREQNRLAIQAGMVYDEDSKSYKFVGTPSSGSGKSNKADGHYISDDKGERYKVIGDSFNNKDAITNLAEKFGLIAEPIPGMPNDANYNDIHIAVISAISNGNKEVIDEAIRLGYMEPEGSQPSTGYSPNSVNTGYNNAYGWTPNKQERNQVTEFFK